MPLTPEERARIARENGAKSRGPVTQEGKDRSRLNSLKTGEHATTLAHVVPTANAIILFEDRRAYARLIQELVAQYQPVNKLALGVVVDIAHSQWQIDRLRSVAVTQWNLAIGAEHAKPGDLAPELRQLVATANAAALLLSGAKVLSQINREIARLETSIIRLERRLKFLHANFNAAAPAPVADEERTELEIEPPMEEPEPELEPEPAAPAGELGEPIILVDPPSAEIDRARRDFPGRPIVILAAPPDDRLPNAA